MAVNKLSILKFLELVIAVTCIGLHSRSQTGNFDTDTVSVTAFGGYIIILVGSFAGVLMSTPFNRRIDVFFCVAGCALFVAAGALNIDHFQDKYKGERRDYGLAKASIAIIGGVAFLVDAFLTWRDG